MRISGDRAVEICANFLRSAAGPLGSAPTRTLRRATLIDPASDEAVDEVLCVLMRRPRSYTGEDLVEVSCHGSPVIVRRVVAIAVSLGARLAEPGEFTRRAFLNGRIDLAQAEAVVQLITARTERAAAQAIRALNGGLSAPLERIRERVLDLVAGLEVTLDFPEEGFALSTTEAAKQADQVADDAHQLLQAARQGRLIHEGLVIAIVGVPNAGKSSLLNALLATDRAIVSPIAGTTRDPVEGALVISGVAVRLIDTAGLGVTDHPIEAEGMRRTRRAISESDLVLLVVDGSVEREINVPETARGKECLVVVNKADLPPCAGSALAGLRVSALSGYGVSALLDALRTWVGQRVAGDGEEGGIVATLRQIELLETVAGALVSGARALGDGGIPVEAALVDLRHALTASGSIVGVEVEEAVLDRIFSSFCVGK